MVAYTPLDNDVEQPTSIHSNPLPAPMNVVGKPKTSRVASLDVFRGLCVFLMMVVDYGGPIFPEIGHAPWNGLHLADFVMPFFLFIAGLSLALAYKKVGDQMDATKKAIVRAAKLFILGVFLQGGYLHGAKSLTYGVDIMRIRWMGILQRIAIAYLVAALCEIWLPSRKWVKFGIVRSYFWQWCLALLLSSLYIALLYGLYVPDWEFNMSSSGLSLPATNGTHVYKVDCGLRGSLTPACNSAGMIDRYILGIGHLYAKPSYQNLKVCSKSKGGLIPEDSPSWCHASFDPEGILGSLTAALTCIIGLQFGHILVQKEDHKERLQSCSLLSTFIFILGLYLVFTVIIRPRRHFFVKPSTGDSIRYITYTFEASYGIIFLLAIAILIATGKISSALSSVDLNHFRVLFPGLSFYYMPVDPFYPSNSFVVPREENELEGALRLLACCPRKMTCN